MALRENLSQDPWYLPSLTLCWVEEKTERHVRKESLYASRLSTSWPRSVSATTSSNSLGKEGLVDPESISPLQYDLILIGIEISSHCNARNQVDISESCNVFQHFREVTTFRYCYRISFNSKRRHMIRRSEGSSPYKNP